jgi:competence protein ComEC
MKFFKYFIFLLFYLFISCEDRIFVEKKPDIVLNSGKYNFDAAGYDFDRVILSKDSSVIELVRCKESEADLCILKNHNPGIYDMFVISGTDTVCSREVFIGTTDHEALNISVLDVKQGDSFIITPPDGLSSVMDGGYGTLGVEDWQGSGSKILLKELISRNISELKYVVETHHDKDHYGGLYDLYDSGVISYSDSLSYRDSLPAFGDTLYFSETAKGVILHYGDLPVDPSTSENDRSLSLKMIFHDFEMIFTGDIEEDAEKVILSRGFLDSLEDYEILKVAHHGSSSSSTQPFLDAVTPIYSVISVGYGNDYGHPTANVLDRLISKGSNVLRTDLNGTVEIYSDGSFFQVSCRK